MASPARIHKPSLTAIALLRVSSDAQDVAWQEADKLKIQEKFGLAFDRTLKLQGVSGTATLENEDIQKILKDLQRPEIGGITVSALDRLFRPKHYAAFGILDYFVAAGKVIWSMREGFIDPATDARRNYRVICDVSGDAGLLDTLIAHLAPGGEIVLAGFYSAPISFVFPPAFMREARIRIAAEWRQDDLIAVRDLVCSGQLSLDNLISHRETAGSAVSAYRTAFGDPSCLKMTLDWRACA